MSDSLPAEERIAAFNALKKIADAGKDDVSGVIDEVYAPDVVWRGSHPLNEVAEPAGITETVWRPLHDSFPDLERRDLIFVAGTYEDRRYVATLGHYCGTFARDWLGIAANGEPLFIRYGEVHQFRDGRIVQSTCLWDILDVIRQSGFWPLPPSLGTEGMWPGPITADGIALQESDPETSRASLAQTLAMQRTLGDYDDESDAGRTGLLNMPQRDFWHEKMMWYGPSGIGTTRGLGGFVDRHQLPFRIAFPNRQGGAQITDPAQGGHYIRIGDGKYSVTGGWPSVRAIHSGGGFLGTTATNKAIQMRVMDFYLHDEGKIRENWVPLDVLDVLKQIGHDVLDRMQDRFGRCPPA